MRHKSYIALGNRFILNFTRMNNHVFLLFHSGLVSALDVPEGLEAMGRDSPLLCMEFCRGGDLRQLLNRPLSCCGLPEVDVLHILRDISSALVYIHGARVVHRDLKPENIVIQLGENNKVNRTFIKKGSAISIVQQHMNSLIFWHIFLCISRKRTN